MDEIEPTRRGAAWIHSLCCPGAELSSALPALRQSNAQPAMHAIAHLGPV